MVTIKKCDLLKSDADFICHQVNCMGVMGSGIAKSIALEWPEVKSSYVRLCKLLRPEELLGRHQRVEVPSGQTIVNIFGQLNFGRDPNVVYTDYDALKKAFSDLRSFLRESDKVAFPYKFGCGLAHGDWAKVESMIVQHFVDFDVEICMKD